MTLADKVPELTMAMPSYGEIKGTKYSVESTNNAKIQADKEAAKAELRAQQFGNKAGTAAATKEGKN